MCLKMAFLYVKILGKNIIELLVKKICSLPRKKRAHVNPVQSSILYSLNLREEPLEAPPLDNILPYQGRLLSGFLSQATS